VKIDDMHMDPGTFLGSQHALMLSIADRWTSGESTTTHYSGLIMTLKVFSERSFLNCKTLSKSMAQSQKGDIR